MSRESRSTQTMLYAHENGYRVNKCGDVLGPQGKPQYLDKSSGGYLRKRIRIDGTRRCFTVHRLVAFQKYGEAMFEQEVEVRHLNGIKTDNSHDNIVIGTSSQNKMDIPVGIRSRRQRRFKHSMRDDSVGVPLTTADIDAIRIIYLTGLFSQAEISKKYGTSRRTIYTVLIYKNCFSTLAASRSGKKRSGDEKT